jgi:S-adenosylmethionine:tRNA ribosyltransferase-isomerase
MKITDFDFHLPQSLIASEPLRKRDDSRLLVLHMDGAIEHRKFHDVVEYLDKGDMLLLNNTKVLPVRLTGIKPTGGRLEILLVRHISGTRWEILCPKRYTGTLKVSEKLSLQVYEGKTADIISSGDLKETLWETGQMPLPPYIKRKPNRMDKQWYQTVYAKCEGSIAAPTAGLHFTEDLLKKLEDKGVLIRYLTLHVGKGTFTPIRTDSVEDHIMEPEYFEIDKRLIEEISNLKGKLISVGTTTTRAIEGFFSNRYAPNTNEPFFAQAKPNGTFRGSTDIFIYPGYRFKAVKGLITNFHLPRSTPLMLVSALCGTEKLLSAYAEAVKKGYRFFSYGDAMLII